MTGPYWYYYFDHKKQKMIKRKTYSRFLHEGGDSRYTYYGKKRFVRPVFKTGSHRYMNLNMKKGVSIPRFNRPVMECGYSKNQVWIGLCRAWLGLEVAKVKGQDETMKYFARAIHTLQGQLGLKERTHFAFLDEQEEKEEPVELDRDDEMFNSDLTDEQWLDHLKQE